MKTLKSIFKLSIMVVFAWGITSCDGYLEDDIVSPNDPAEVTPELLLSNVQVATFATYSGQLTRQSLVFAQQIAGTEEGSQSTEIAQYNVTEVTNENEWEVIWAGSVVDCRNIISDYGAEGPYYAGIAKVIMALNIGLATDLWGAVPFDEGGLGLEVDLQPQFESQEVILGKIQVLLDNAIADLQRPLADNAFVPGADDLIFGGNVDNWIVTAYILKARYANRLSERDPAGSAADVLAHLTSSGVTSSATDAFMAFFGGNAANQWDAFQSNRQGYYSVSESFVNLLVDNDDPRLPFFVAEDGDGGFSGTPFDDPTITGTSYVGSYYSTPSAPLPLVSYVEAKFLEAEALLRGGGSAGDAATALNEAVIASVEQVTGAAAPADFVDAFASEDAGSITLEKIMTQKYIAMFIQIEVYADQRRTDIPSLNPNPNAVNPGIPKRLPTPQSERLYNPNAIVVGNILLPVYWDVN
ncbi:SusD/RagB family nutrient-binding outer membrane lipoprotein [Cryomorpha ignava]|uniref:SusD/RagB family nutrient-binding outer membrane lipoprotein n=1 Tax=Cryomorpha ignava TaxID=101383 RepID=A0A7K3WQF8_9FLAO|nr:SusD/RagB family nutrient-binding outer membrane lipoprotein [Cryomorpha ignava]NEN22995.1 SusD/RagB family nutrient-binding outer membrane lipoprotein [Cryomorpha ignava]